MLTSESEIRNVLLDNDSFKPEDNSAEVFNQVNQSVSSDIDSRTNIIPTSDLPSMSSNPTTESKDNQKSNFELSQSNISTNDRVSGLTKVFSFMSDCIYRVVKPFSSINVKFAVKAEDFTTDVENQVDQSLNSHSDKRINTRSTSDSLTIQLNSTAEYNRNSNLESTQSDTSENDCIDTLTKVFSFIDDCINCFVKRFSSIDEKYKVKMPKGYSENMAGMSAPNWSYIKPNPKVNLFLSLVFLVIQIINICDTISQWNEQMESKIKIVWYGVLVSNIDQMFILLVCLLTALTKGLWWSNSVFVLTLLYDAVVIVLEIFAYHYPESSKNPAYGVTVLISIVCRDIPYVLLYSTWAHVLECEISKLTYMNEFFDPQENLESLLPFNTKTFIVVAFISTGFNAILMLILIIALRIEEWNVAMIWFSLRILLPAILLLMVITSWVIRDNTIRKFLDTHKDDIKSNKDNIGALVRLQTEVNTSLLSKTFLAANIIPFILFLLDLAKGVLFGKYE